MARPKRIDFPHTLFHVFSRTNSGDTAFLVPKDYDKFYYYLRKYLQMFDFRLHAFCLLPNHFHLLLESRQNPGLSELMRRLLTAYTVYFNRRHKRHGHLFQGRFKSLVVEKSDYFIELSRYIHLNPSRKNPSNDPEKYPASSLRYYLSGGEPDFLYTREILSWFEGDRRAYSEYVKKGVEEGTMPRITGQKYIGGKEFTRRMNKRVDLLGRGKSRAQEALRRRKAWTRERNNKKAEIILNIVARHFSVSPHEIMNARYKRGSPGNARLVYISLLREHLPWKCRQIQDYLNIRGNIYDYITRLQGDERLVKIKDKLSEKIRRNFCKY